MKDGDFRTKQLDFATRAIHDGYDSSSANGALNPPIYMSSTFAFDTVKDGADIFSGDSNACTYTRLGNPSLRVLEDRMASLEGGEAALVTSSGMGAISSTLWSLLSAGDEIIVDQTLYGCTFALMRHGLTRFGIKVHHLDMTQPDLLAEACSDKTRLIYFETPANPNMRLIDITKVCAVAHRRDAKVIVDNTFCTPYLQRPIELGADLVVHSATKYLGGHGDSMAGVVVGSDEDIQAIRMSGLKDMTGAVLSPMDAFLITRGIKTLEVRMERHCSSAVAIAEYLEQHQAVKSIYYPGLKSFPQYELAQQQMALPGGMIAFELRGDLHNSIAFMDALKLVTRAVSLGDTETLIQHPASMTHSTYTPEEQAEHGITPTLIRLSVGLESVRDIIDDLEQALQAGQTYRLREAS